MDVTFADGAIERYEDRPFARGAQGEIYRSADGAHALKLYHPRHATPEYARQLDQIIERYNPTLGDPSWGEVLVWPQKRAVSPRLGTRMRYVSDMVRLDHLMYRAAYEALPPEKRGNWLGRVAIAIKLARAVDRLAQYNICHSDLSDHNVLVDAATGRMALLDGDGVIIPDVIPPSVLGSREYMAPELVTGAVREPSLATDRHALAVLLYRLLLYKHPLLGPKRYAGDPEEDERLMLGERPLYIEHPSDSSNRPEGMRNTTAALTPRLRALFQRAFVDGLRLPAARPLPREWLEALTGLWDTLLPCPNSVCAQGYFAAPVSGPLVCGNCNTTLPAPDWIPLLRISAQSASEPATVDGASGVLVWPGRMLYPWHALPPASADTPDATPYAVFAYEAREQAWYLENVRLPELHGGRERDGHVEWQPIPLGVRVRLRPGVRLRFTSDAEAREAVVEKRETGGVFDGGELAGLPEIVSGNSQWPTIVPGRSHAATSADEADAEEQSALAHMLSLQVYLVVETSRLTQSASAASIRAAIELICHELGANPATAEIASLRAITFGARVQQTVPVSLKHFTMPPLAASGPSLLGEALAVLNETLDVELLSEWSAHRIGYKPVVVLLTAATPSDHWQPQAHRLAARASDVTLVPILIGNQRNPDVFRRLERAPLLAEQLTGAALRDAWKASTYIEWQAH